MSKVYTLEVVACDEQIESEVIFESVYNFSRDSSPGPMDIPNTAGHYSAARIIFPTLEHLDFLTCLCSGEPSEKMNLSITTETVVLQQKKVTSTTGCTQLV